MADLTGSVRFHIGYVGGYSKTEYLKAVADSFPKLPPAQHKRILRGFWKDHQRMFLELIMLRNIDSGNVSRLVDIEGAERLEAALSGGKGAILPVPHFGNIRLLHYFLALTGYPVSVVSSAYADDPEIVRRFKLGITSEVHQVGFRGDNPRWIIQALKANRLVQIASTAEAGNAGVEVDFMNRRLFLTSGWIRLAMMTGAPILPAWIQRGSDERHTIHIEPPFPLADESDKNDRIRQTAQNLLSSFEGIYRKKPQLIDWMSWMVRLSEAKEYFGKEGL